MKRSYRRKPRRTLKGKRRMSKKRYSRGKKSETTNYIAFKSKVLSSVYALDLTPQGGPRTISGSYTVLWGDDGTNPVPNRCQYITPFSGPEWTRWSTRYKWYKITGCKMRFIPLAYPNLPYNGPGQATVIATMYASNPALLVDGDTPYPVYCQRADYNDRSHVNRTVSIFRKVSKVSRTLAKNWYTTGAQPSDALEQLGTNASTHFRVPCTPETIINGDAGRTIDTVIGSLEVTYYFKMKEEYVT